jgi:hypothetical protein
VAGCWTAVVAAAQLPVANLLTGRAVAITAAPPASTHQDPIHECMLRVKNVSVGHVVMNAVRIVLMVPSGETKRMLHVTFQQSSSAMLTQCNRPGSGVIQALLVSDTSRQVTHHSICSWRATRAHRPHNTPHRAGSCSHAPMRLSHQQDNTRQALTPTRQPCPAAYLQGCLSQDLMLLHLVSQRTSAEHSTCKHSGHNTTDVGMWDSEHSARSAEHSTCKSKGHNAARTGATTQHRCQAICG